MTFSINSIAWEYVNKRFPHASILEKEKIVEDWINKIPDSQTLVEDFKRRVGDPKGKKVLDAGSGPGGVSVAFTQAGGEVCGVDVEKDLYDISQLLARTYGVSVKFFLYKGSILPFGNDTFDYAISVSVLEHTTDPAKYLSEILRVIKPGGKLYLAFPNKLWPKETHTGIWFLTFLPVLLRPYLVRLLKRNPLEENNLHFYTYFDLKRILNNSSYGNAFWRIVPEEGQTKSGIKKIVKKVLGIFGISYKIFLSHISIIIEKTN